MFSENNRQLSLFLSYASEDFDRVQVIYTKLQAVGLNPWMDKHKILPGENWEYSIWSALRQADFLLICLSERAVKKRSFLQREIKKALILSEEKLQEDIFLIPVLLEECVIPDSLNQFQGIRLHGNEGFESLLKAIEVGSERRNLPFKVTYGNDTLRVSSNRINENNSGKLIFEAKVEYPQIIGLAEGWVQEINQSILVFARKILQNTRKFLLEYENDPESDRGRGYILEVTYSIALLGHNIISIEFNVYSYLEGAAHPNYQLLTLNSYLSPAFDIELEDLFEDKTEYLNFVSNYCLDDLAKQAIKDDNLGSEKGSTESYRNLFWVDGVAPEVENFSEFKLTPKSIVFLFSPYQVGSYAWGAREVEMNYSEVLERLDRNGPLSLVLAAY